MTQDGQAAAARVEVKELLAAHAVQRAGEVSVA